MRFSSLPLCFPSFPSPQHNLARLLSLSPPFGSAAKSRKSMACKGERAKEPKTRLDDRGKKSLTKNLPARQYKAFKEPKMQRRNSDTCQTGWWKKRNNGSFFLCSSLDSSFFSPPKGELVLFSLPFLLPSSAAAAWRGKRSQQFVDQGRRRETGVRGGKGETKTNVRKVSNLWRGKEKNWKWQLWPEKKGGRETEGGGAGGTFSKCHC